MSRSVPATMRGTPRAAEGRTMTDSDHTNAPDDADTVAVADLPPAFNLRVSADKVCVLLDCPDPHRDLGSVVSQVMAGFRELEIPEYPDPEFLTEILTNACAEGEHLVDTPLIMGAHPVQPQHGRLEWARDFFADGWAVDEKTGSVDFWAKLDNRAVKAGEPLLAVHPAVQGEPGLNVFGNKIPVDKAEKARMRGGKGVVEATDEQDVVTFTAEIDGRIRCADGVLSVDDVYIIKGNVNLDTGNINHTGTLQIEGDVELGARIDAGGDVVVKGMMEGCQLKCGGSLMVTGGIVGGEEYAIEVGGAVQARYIREAYINAESDVTVGNEITHSVVRTRGKVLVPGGRIVGGFTLARQGITVGEAGASGAADTTLVAGLDPALAERVAALQGKAEQMEKARHKIRKALEATAANAAALDEKAARTRAGLERKAQNLAQAVADTEASIQQLISKSASESREEVAILRELWSGTTIQLGQFKTTVKASVMKPRLARRNRSEVRILPLGDGNMPDD